MKKFLAAAVLLLFFNTFLAGSVGKSWERAVPESAGYEYGYCT